MAMTTIRNGLVFPEGPRWRDGRLWVSDMQDRRVLAVRADGTSETICEVPGLPSGLGWLPDGRMLVVSMLDRRLLRMDPGGLALHADLSSLALHACNDMVVDAEGRAWVGNLGGPFGKDVPPPTVLIRVDPDGSPRVAAEGVRFPNGLVISADGRTLIVAESYDARLTAFDIGADGTLSNHRVWAQLDAGVSPDGCCLDAEGAVWTASPTSREVLRVREGGEVARRVPCDQRAVACMLGGPSRRTLFILSAPSLDPVKCRQRRGGRVDALEVDVPGDGLP